MSYEYAKVTSSNCNDCVHKSVCSYKEDFLDICNAVAGAHVNKYLSDGKIKITDVIVYKDILDEIVIKCKHFRVDSDSITFQPYPQSNIRDWATTSVASDTPNSVTTISNVTKSKINPPSTISTTTDYIFE